MRPEIPQEGVREIQIVVNERQSDKVKETIRDVDGTQTKY
jgi:dTDP-glucose pyrophosphorylase